MSPLVLDVARDEVLSYCRRMQQQDDTEGFDSSWQAYIYLTQKTEKQEKACDIEIKDEIVDGKACQELNMFKQYIRTQMRHGNMKGFIDTLVRDALVEQIQIEREEKGATLGEVIKQVDDSVPGPESPARDALNKSLREIFDEYDANKDGKLNVAEFRTAMKSMGDELSARTVSTIYQALDSHGWMTFDEFVTVVEAEQVRSHTQFAKVLRIMARGQSIYSGELPDGMHSIDM